MTTNEDLDNLLLADLDALAKLTYTQSVVEQSNTSVVAYELIERFGGKYKMSYVSYYNSLLQNDKNKIYT